MFIINKIKLICRQAGKYLVPIISWAILAPFSVIADSTAGVPVSTCPGNTNDVAGLLNFFRCLIQDSLVPLLITLAIIFFIVGVIRFVLNADDPTKMAEGRNFMIWGIIGLFAIVSIWGLVKILTGTFGISFAIPQLQQ